MNRRASTFAFGDDITRVELPLIRETETEWKITDSLHRASKPAKQNRI